MDANDTDRHVKIDFYLFAQSKSKIKSNEMDKNAVNAARIINRNNDENNCNNKAIKIIDKESAETTKLKIKRNSAKDAFTSIKSTSYGVHVENNMKLFCTFLLPLMLLLNPYILSAAAGKSNKEFSMEIFIDFG